MSSDLKAGRELDAKVAELMGAVWQEFDDASNYRKRGSVRGLFDLDSIIPGGRLLALVCADGAMRFFDGLWPYSSSMTAAMLVVDKMAERGFWCVMKSPFTPEDNCVAGFTPHGTTGWNGRPDHRVIAPTLPHAICLAALQAMTGELSPDESALRASHPPTQPTQENG